MIKISKTEKEQLEKNGLIQYKNKTKGEEPNIYVANKYHPSRAKTWYVVERDDILLFLGRITKEDLEKKRNDRKNNN